MRAAITRDETIAQCLRLRRGALDLLALQMTPADFVLTVNRVSTSAWRNFLFADVCALPLSELLGADAALLNAEHGAILREFAGAGVQRIITARTQLRLIDAVAGRLDLHPILLKGAVPVAEGRVAFDLGDIDVLLDPANIEAFAHELIARGYWNAAPGSFARLAAVDALPIEPHDAFHVGIRVPFAGSIETESLSGFDRLRRLRNVPHLVHLIQHATTGHAHRRGMVRDVAFMVDAARRCAPGELDAVRTALAATRDATENLATLALVRAAANGEMVAVLASRYEAIACSTYDVASRTLRPIDRFLPNGSAERGFYIAGGWNAARRAKAQLLNPMSCNSRWYWPWLGERSPRAANALGYLLRTPYRLIVIMYLGVSALRVRWRYATIWRAKAVARTAPQP